MSFNERERKRDVVYMSLGGRHKAKVAWRLLLGETGTLHPHPSVQPAYSQRPVVGWLWSGLWTQTKWKTIEDVKKKTNREREREREMLQVQWRWLLFPSLARGWAPGGHPWRLAHLPPKDSTQPLWLNAHSCTECSLGQIQAKLLPYELLEQAWHHIMFSVDEELEENSWQQMQARRLAFDSSRHTNLSLLSVMRTFGSRW